VARTLSIAEEATVVGDAAVTAMGRALGARGRVLIALDNVEACPGAAAAILAWLDLAPEARFLVTSRAPLYVLGEEVIEIGPLTVPDAGVELFVSRVRSVRQDWVPTLDEERAIADVVRHVRGVPLAIELCASRFCSAEPRPVRHVIPRHPGALDPAEAVAWSFRKLDPDERETLAQLSVFRGGFTFEAAERVVEIPSERPLPCHVSAVLEGLLAKGLIQQVRAESVPRYTICEAIHEQAAAHLAEGVEACGAPWRHARHYLGRAAGPLTDLPDTEISARTREELVAERENLEAVMAFGASRGRRDIVLEAAIALDFLSSGTGLSRAQLAMLDEALASPGSIDPLMIGRALGVRAGALRALGRLAEAEQDARVALSLARRAGSTRQIVAMHLAVGNARFQLGDLEEALAHTRAAVREASSSGDRAEPLALQQLGGVLQAMGDAPGARSHYEAALELASLLDDQVAEARAAMGLGSYHLEAGDLTRAEASYDRALLITRRLGMTRNARIVMGYLGVLHLDAGRTQEAERWLDAAVRLSRNVGDLRIEGIFEGMRGAALATLDLADEARAAFSQARGLLADNPYFGAVIELHRGLLDLADARAAREEGAEVRTATLMMAARERLAMAERSVGETPPLVKRSDDARIAARILRRAIAAME
jgi:predicted ATPase